MISSSGGSVTPLALRFSVTEATRSRSSLAMMTSSSTIATTWSMISVAARAWGIAKTVHARLAANSSVLIFTFFETSDHILHNVGNLVAVATHTFEDELKLCGVFPFQVGVVEVGHSI